MRLLLGAVFNGFGTGEGRLEGGVSETLMINIDRST
jgi:hypothetical protein